MKIRMNHSMMYMLFALFMMVAFTPAADAHSHECCQSSPKVEKVYVNPESIHISEEGIFAYAEGAEKPVVGNTLSYDEKGLYLIPVSEKGPCGIHHGWCHACGGCGVLYCPMVCCCPFGGGG